MKEEYNYYKVTFEVEWDNGDTEEITVDSSQDRSRLPWSHNKVFVRELDSLYRQPTVFGEGELRGNYYSTRVLNFDKIKSWEKIGSEEVSVYEGEL